MNENSNQKNDLQPLVDFLHQIPPSLPPFFLGPSGCFSGIEKEKRLTRALGVPVSGGCIR
jgi:hypothetical protein